MGQGPDLLPRVTLSEPAARPWVPSDSGRDVAVLMSGGVDSSLAAALLAERGWRVLGLTMKLPVAERWRALGSAAVADAAAVCRHLGLAHAVVDVEAAFQQEVIEPFRQAYAQGLTPNPCCLCNARLKFGLVWDAVERGLGLRHLATGHYARVLHEDGGRTALARGADPERDQSYFIYRIPAHRLPFLLLPLGELGKGQARELARERALPVADRADSMELCFAGQGNYREALGPAADATPGPILDLQGNVLGHHGGIIHFTLGQRRGLRVALGEPAYVVRIRPADRAVVVGTRAQASRRRVVAERLHVLLPERLRPGQRLGGKVRSAGGEPEPCTVVEVGEDAMAAEFDEPQFAPAPGQHLVLYDATGRVVGGGILRGE